MLKNLKTKTNIWQYFLKDLTIWKTTSFKKLKLFKNTLQGFFSQLLNLNKKFFLFLLFEPFQPNSYPNRPSLSNSNRKLLYPLSIIKRHQLCPRFLQKCRTHLRAGPSINGRDLPFP